MADKNTTVGTVHGKLQLVIGDSEPILLTTLALPIKIFNGSDYATYSLKIDLAEVTDTIQAIFTTAEAKEADHG